jgi:Zn-finger nucleic acid-binding protein
LKCPKCNAELTPATRHKLEVNYCQSCKGMWLEHQELDQLEDEVFDFGDDAKGTLVFSSTPTTAKCPECDALLKRFKYRLFDLELEFCGNQHGYWLDEDEDKRVLELMKKEETDYERKVLAEDKWTTVLKHMRSGSFLDKVRNLFQ